LILKDIPLREIFRGSSQALDFSGAGAHRGLAFNKVIHKLRVGFTNRCEIKDLAAVREAHLKLRRASAR
jgi:hypothetical protein